MFVESKNYFVAYTALFSVYIVIMSVFEGIQLANYKKTNYFNDYWNIVDLTFIVLMITYSLMSFMNLDWRCKSLH